jgi:hypothetical protein
MKTDDLIETLALDAACRPGARPDGPFAAWTAVGVAASAFTMAIAYGVRPGAGEWLLSTGFLYKLAYASALAGAGGWLVTRLGRPGVPVGPAAAVLAGVVILAALIAAVQLVGAEPAERLRLWLGDTWTTCSRNVLMLSGVALPLALLGARRFAPTRPALAGAAAGLMTGGVGAAVFGFACPETSPAFVATWYTLGVALSAALGAALGRPLLRW